jgi:hypothetical protein
MKIIFLLILFSVSFNAVSQKSFKTWKYNIIDKGSYLKLNALSIADLSLPTIQPGYEYKFSDRLGAEIAIGIPLGFIGKRKTDSTFFKYYKLRSTLKYYTNRKDKYFGFEIFYTHAKYSRYYNSYYLGKKGPRYISDYTISKKSVFGCDVKTGKNFLLSNKMFLESFVGIGIRFVNINLPVNINPKKQEYYNNHFLQIIDIVGAKITPHITFGLQLSYKL